MNKRKLLIPVLLVLGIFMMAFMTSCADEKGTTGTTGGEPVDIELIDRDGNKQTVDLSKLESMTGESGFIKSTGTIVGPAELTGPKLVDVLEKIGGITPEDALMITAGDGYEMTYTYDQVMGKVMTYDDKGEPQKIGDTEAILAIESSVEEVLEKAPRLCFISDEKLLSDGHFWMKEVAAIKVVPGVEEWEISLSGIEEATMDRPTFESIATCGRSTHPAQEYEDEGEKAVYNGVPLWVMVSMVDGADDEDGHYRFNRELSRTGYTVQVISADGYKAELSSQDVAYNDGIFLAYLKNDEPLDKDSGPLQLVGPELPSKKDAVKQVKEIKLINLP